MLFDDQLAALAARLASSVGTRGGELDFALLVDGLAAEREQGITIDVAYRFFSTEQRKFIVADTPGHEQYTRNMVTGASTADLAVILIDARKGVLTQTRRHSFLVHLLGIPRVVLAVNKMDLVGYQRATFEHDRTPTTATSPRASASTTSPPSRCRRSYGDNVTRARRATCPGTRGRRCLQHLESVADVGRSSRAAPFRMPVQWVNRPNASFRGFCRADRQRQRAAGRARARAALGPRERRWRASSRPTASCPRRSPASR